MTITVDRRRTGHVREGLGPHDLGRIPQGFCRVFADFVLVDPGTTIVNHRQLERGAPHPQPEQVSGYGAVAEIAAPGEGRRRVAQPSPSPAVVAVTRPPVLVARIADSTDVPAGAALLSRVCLARGPQGRLPGSATAMSVPGFCDIVTTTLARGRVDLITTDGTVTGVSCWIGHPAHGHDLTPSAIPALARGSGDDDPLHRLSMLGVPAGEPHQHLACLAAWPGHGARSITQHLLRRQQIIADRDRHTLYTEIHDDFNTVPDVHGSAWLPPYCHTQVHLIPCRGLRATASAMWVSQHLGGAR
ncbi:hypothetical protein DMB66_32830 [Actinoplanes sp. ATCC 53533]|nr:hypothetical protein DMB66_32830 [Actinoplanes sp. ATCC 53533]